MFGKTRIAVTPAVSVSLAVLAAAILAEPARADQDRVVHTHYDGITNDLLTAGLGALGLQSATPPAISDPLHPTTEELRRLLNVSADDLVVRISDRDRQDVIDRLRDCTAEGRLTLAEFDDVVQDLAGILRHATTGNIQLSPQAH